MHPEFQLLERVVALEKDLEWSQRFLLSLPPLSLRSP